MGSGKFAVHPLNVCLVADAPEDFGPIFRVFSCDQPWPRFKKPVAAMVASVRYYPVHKNIHSYGQAVF